MNDYSGGRIAPAPSENVSERPERVVPYRGLFLAPDIEQADDDGDDDE